MYYYNKEQRYYYNNRIEIAELYLDSMQIMIDSSKYCFKKMKYHANTTQRKSK